MSKSRSRKSRRPYSHLATVVAALCLVAQALPLLHFLVVRHARCEVHGEAIHVGEETTVGASTSPRDPSQRSMQSSDHHEDDHEHEHCQLLSERRDATFEHSTMVVAAVARAVELEPRACASPTTGCPLYRLAPKLSPPHVA